MILRFVLLSILLSLLLRAVSRLWSGVIRGIQSDGAHAGSRRDDAQVPQRSVPMVRDPICGTFVVPDHAILLTSGRQRVYFCSTECREQYRTNAETRSAAVHGRTA